MIRSALVVAIHVRRTQTDGESRYDQPLETETDEIVKSKNNPQERRAEEPAPKYIRFERFDDIAIGNRVIEPNVLAVLVNFVSPSKSDEQSSGDVLDDPEIHRKQNHADKEDHQKTACKPVRKDEEKYRQCFEDQMKEARVRMCAGRCSARSGRRHIFVESRNLERIGLMQMERYDDK